VNGQVEVKNFTVLSLDGGGEVTHDWCISVKSDVFAKPKFHEINFSN
jgi:hypothetical protein